MSVADASAVSRPIKPLDKTDFYQTPEVCTTALIREFSLDQSMTYLDPCCGQRAIGNVFRRHRIPIQEEDLYPTDQGESKNFLTSPGESHDCIVANPPYSKKNSFILHAISRFDHVFMILPMQVVNYNEFHAIFLNRKEYMGRLLMTPKFFMTEEYQVGLTQRGGVSSYAWFYWSRVGEKLVPAESFERYCDLDLITI
jgi:hypothetical protein